nr:UPF0481 protein At3g47200-like [Ipomoea batatas]
MIKLRSKTNLRSDIESIWALECGAPKRSYSEEYSVKSYHFERRIFPLPAEKFVFGGITVDLRETKPVENRSNQEGFGFVIVEKLERVMFGANQDANGELHQLMKLGVLPEQTAATCKSSRGDYLKPTLVSIGPKYVFSEKHFKGVARFKNQEYKDKYFKSFLQRGGETRTKHDEYREHLKDPKLNLVEKARKYYEEIGINCPSSDQDLANMLVSDGGFVVEFVLRCKKGGRDDPRIKEKGKEARKDMLCFENQLPFEVLTALYQKMISYTNPAETDPPSFIRLVKFAFASFAPNITLSNFFDDNKPENPLDILHVLHSLCLPPINNNPHQNQTMEWPTVVHINSATELRDVGVSFNNTGEVYTMPRQYDTISSLKECKDTTSLFDLTFSGGVMKIPSFKVDDFTEIFFGNMIALEQRRTLKPKYYTDYARLMDHLVDTHLDVSLLRKNGTIHNLLGEDIKVADVFNSVCVKVDITTNFYFAPLYTAVNRHCRNTRLVWKARLKTDYFSDPWKGISSIAGAIVLLLGASLTLKSLLS